MAGAKGLCTTIKKLIRYTPNGGLFSGKKINNMLQRKFDQAVKSYFPNVRDLTPFYQQVISHSQYSNGAWLY